jgi:tetratricopeptide (TPR) repeat protein
LAEVLEAETESAPALSRRKRRRLAALVIVLVGITALYLSLPRSWFEIPDERAPTQAGQPTGDAEGPSAKPSPELLAEAARQSPLDYVARSRYGMALAAVGRPREAEAEFVAARKLAPDSPIVHHNLGIFYLNGSRLTQADAAFIRELELAPGDPNAHYYRGLVAQRRLRTEAAIAQFRYTIAMAPDFADAYLALAVQSTRKEPEAKIRQYVDRYVELTGNKGMANYVLSGAYRTWGRYADAARYGEVSVQIEPENYAYWHNLGQVYSYAKRTEDAERALGKALTLARDPSTVLIELGMNAQAARRYPDALKYFQRALAASPKSGPVHSYLSRVYRYMGDEVSSDRELRAFRQWERAARVHREPVSSSAPPSGPP